MSLKLHIRYLTNSYESLRAPLSRREEPRYVGEQIYTMQWENYTLLKRKPSKDEYDYADTWHFYPVSLMVFSTDEIIKMLKGNGHY